MGPSTSSGACQTSDAVGQPERGHARLQREEQPIGGRNRRPDGSRRHLDRPDRRGWKHGHGHVGHDLLRVDRDRRQDERAQGSLWCAREPHSIIASEIGASARSSIRSAVEFLPTRDASNHRRPRFRLAVHAVDCAPAARAVHLLRDSSVRHVAGRDCAAAARRHHPLGRSEERLRAGGAAVRARRARKRRAGPRDLLRHAVDDGPDGRRGRAGAASRVRSGDDPDRAGRAALRDRSPPSCASGPAMAISSRRRRLASP